MQVKAEAVAAAQERLEATKAALEQRREELLAKEAQLKEAACAAEAAASAAAAQEDRLRAREAILPLQGIMLRGPPRSVPGCQSYAQIPSVCLFSCKPASELCSIHVLRIPQSPTCPFILSMPSQLRTVGFVVGCSLLGKTMLGEY